MSNRMFPVPCRKCGARFTRARRQERVCLSCKRPAERLRQLGKLTESRVLDVITLEARILCMLSQVSGSEKTACRMLNEARKAIRVPGLQTYARHMLMLAEDTRAGDPWTRADQLRILGAVWDGPC